MARVLTQERIDEIVKRYRPRGYTIKPTHHRWQWDTAEVCNKKRVIACPTLKDDESLFLFIHEVGHVTLGHFKHKLPRHKEEFEAERFALHVFRAEGIPVTKYIMNLVRLRLQGHIDYDLKRNIPILPHVARWARHRCYRGRSTSIRNHQRH
jgi:hypothetical protein